MAENKTNVMRILDKKKIEYEMRANGRVLVAGYTVHAFVDSRGMPVKPPKEIAKKLLDAYDADAGAGKK